MFNKPLTAIALATGIASAGILVLPALADDNPCLQPQDQLVAALCSDVELRSMAEQQLEVRTALWNRLTPTQQAKFRQEQIAWRDLTARSCQVEQQPLSAERKNCPRQAEARRIEFLQHYHQTDTPTALHPNAPPQVTSTASVAATDDHGTAAYQGGLRDRAAWEEWFNSLQGDYKTGAFYWASQRSLPHPGSCQQMSAEFTAGCTAAKSRLAPSDAQRRSQPDYKLGWNAWTPQDTSPVQRSDQTGVDLANAVAISSKAAAPEAAAAPAPAPAYHPTSVAGTVNEQCAAVRNGTETSDYWKTRCAHLNTAVNGRSENGRDGGGIIQDIARREAVQQPPAPAASAEPPASGSGLPAADETAPETQPSAHLNYSRPLYTKEGAIVCPAEVFFDRRVGHGFDAVMDAYLSVFYRQTKAEKAGCQVWHGGIAVRASLSALIPGFISVEDVYVTKEFMLTNTP